MRRSDVISVVHAKAPHLAREGEEPLSAARRVAPLRQPGSLRRAVRGMVNPRLRRMACLVLLAALEYTAQSTSAPPADTVAALRVSAAPLVRVGVDTLQRFEAHAAEQQVAALSTWAERAASLVRKTSTSCWSDAVVSLKAFDCRLLSTDGHRRLALAIASCTLASAGKGALQCAASVPFDRCAKKLQAEQWTSFEHAQRDVTAVCFATQLDLMAGNFSANVAAAAGVLLDGVTALHAVQQAQLEAQIQLQSMQERAIERQESYLALSAEQVAISQAQALALQQVAATMHNTTSLSVANLEASNALASGLGWLLSLRSSFEWTAAMAAQLLCSYYAARTLWWLVVTRRVEKRRLAALERALLGRMRAELQASDAAVAALMQGLEHRIMAELHCLKATIAARGAHSEEWLALEAPSRDVPALEPPKAPLAQSAAKTRARGTQRRHA
jgi:hypothetical protein